MKKLYLILAMFFTTYSIHAQSNKFEMGIEGGPGIGGNSKTSVDLGNGNYIFSLYAEVSYSYGITGLYKLSDHISIKTGLQYRQNAFDEKVTDYENGKPNTSDFGQISVDYLALPVMIRYSFGNKINCFINGGPYLDYFLKEAIRGYIATANHQTVIYASNPNSPFDLGATLGIGAGINILPRLRIELEAGGDYMLFNFKPAQTNTPDATNTRFFGKLLLGIRYRLGKGE